MMLKNNKVLNNAGWIIAGKVAQSLISLIIATLSARYLGPSNYGIIAYASSIVAFVLPLAQLGMRNVLVEEIISKPDCEGKILGTSMTISLISSLICIIGCIAFVSVVNAGERDTIIVCALYSISLVFRMLEMIEYWYQAKLLSKYTSLASLIAYCICAVYRIFLLVTGKTVYWFAVSYSLDFCIIAIILLLLYKKNGNQKLSFSLAIGKQIFSSSKYYIVPSMMMTLFSQTDKIMIKMMLGNSETGYYSTAVTCANLTSFVFLAIIDSFRPLIFGAKQNMSEKYEKRLTLLYAIVIYLGVAQSLVFTFFAKYIVGILYGKEFLPAIPILQIIVWYTAFSYMGSVRNIWMLAENRQQYLWIINLTGALLNIAGNFILIPILGAAGAAIASVATQFFMNFVLSMLFKPICPTVQLVWDALNPRLLAHEIKKILNKK